MKNKKRMKSTAVALIVIMIFSMFSLACSNSGNKPANLGETVSVENEETTYKRMSTDSYVVGDYEFVKEIKDNRCIITCYEFGEKQWAQTVSSFNGFDDFRMGVPSFSLDEDGVDPDKYIYLWVNVDSKLTIFSLYDGEQMVEFEGFDYVVDCVGTLTDCFIAHNDGYDLSVVTETGRIIYEDYLGDEKPITKLYSDESYVYLITDETDVTYDELERFEKVSWKELWRKSILSVEATSTLPPQGDKSYEADNLFDGDNATVWSEGVAGSGVGEKITVKIDPAISYYSYVISTGHHGSDELFQQNNRVLKFKITDSMGDENVFECQNGYGSFYVCDGSEWFEIEILEVEKGTKYDDTCISEICFDFS